MKLQKSSSVEDTNIHSGNQISRILFGIFHVTLAMHSLTILEKPGLSSSACKTDFIDHRAATIGVFQG